MKKFNFKIVVQCGLHQGEDQQEAQENFAKFSGLNSWMDMCKEAEIGGHKIEITEVEE